MKDISKLSIDIKNLNTGITKQLVKAQKEAAHKIWEDIIRQAPMKTGNYISSITIGETIIKDGIIKTFIGSDLNVDTKDGKKYNLGSLLENGTDPHSIPNAFGWGEIYGYDSEQYKRTLSKTWHPGTTAQPHYLPSLQKNKKYYNDLISKAIKGDDL